MLQLFRLAGCIKTASLKTHPNSNEHAKIISRKYKASQISKQTLDEFFRLCEAVIHIAEVEIPLVWLFETSQKQFKVTYTQSALWKRFAVDEIVATPTISSTETSNIFINFNCYEWKITDLGRSAKWIWLVRIYTVKIYIVGARVGDAWN